MGENTFQKIGESEKVLFGPRAALICGFNPEEQEILVGFFRVIEMMDLHLVFVKDSDAGTTIQNLMALPHLTGLGFPSGLDRTVLLGGITENELHRTLSAYRGLEWPRPLWATLTPVSASWPLSALISELKKERTAVAKGSRPGES